MHLRSERTLRNCCAFLWEEFNFDICNGFEKGRYTWGCFTLLFFMVGFPACLAIIWEMYRSHKAGVSLTPSDFLILNLSIMDAAFLAFIPPGLVNHFFMQSWPFEALWNAVYALNTCGRPFLMACFCFDCYLAVVHPITYHKNKGLAPRALMAAIVWILTAVNGVIFFLFYKTFFSFLPAVTFLIAILIIGVCDALIVHALVKPDPGRRKSIHHQKQRAIQTLVYSLAMTTISYLPPVILFSIGKPLTGSFTTFVCTIALPILIMSTMGSAVMPLLHLHNTGRLKCLGLKPC